MMAKVIGAAIVFTVVVFVHELGHLFAARWAGVRVQACAIRSRAGATKRQRRSGNGPCRPSGDQLRVVLW